MAAVLRVGLEPESRDLAPALRVARSAGIRHSLWLLMQSLEGQLV